MQINYYLQQPVTQNSLKDVVESQQCCKKIIILSKNKKMNDIKKNNQV